MDETSLRKIHPAIFTGTYQSRGTPTIGVLLMSEFDDILIQLDRNLTHLCFIRGYPTEFPLSRDMVFSSSTTFTEGNIMPINHSTLTKGQVRKLNALRKSVGDDIEPPRDCRRLQLLRRRSHYEQDNEQVFT